MSADRETAAELYRSQGIGSKIGFGRRAAVLVIDFTYGFTDPSLPIGANMTAALSATAGVLETARTYDIPIIYTVNAYQDDLRDAGVWPEKYPSLSNLTMGTRGVEIDAAVKPEDHDLVLTKQFPSAFFGTPLLAALTSKGIDTLVLCGCTTSGCIRATAVDGLQHGYRVIVPEDCVADRHEDPHRANLFDIGMKYGDVETSTVVRAELQRLATSSK